MKMGLLGFNSEPEFQKLSDMVAGCQNSEAARRQGGFCMPEWNLAKEYAASMLITIVAIMANTATINVLNANPLTSTSLNSVK